MVRKKETIGTAFATGHRAGLVALGVNLADSIDTMDRADAVYLRLVRVFLATCRQIESIDRAQAVAALRPRNASTATTGAPRTLVDELRARREGRRGKRGAA
jgi:hypothetical protein